MAGTLIGRREWTLDNDKDGHRDYGIQFLVRVDDVLDGPLIAALTAGLPRPGAYWLYGNDSDPWAFATGEIGVRPVLTDEIGNYYLITHKFSTRPNKRCQDSQYNNPLDEPFKISGSFNPQSREKWFGRDGKPFLTSSYEFFTGPETEFDESKPTVKIGMNLPFLPLALWTEMMHTLNDTPMWGIPEKCVKFSNVTFQRLLYGTCSYYYSADLDFDIDFRGFDRPVMDRGTRYLKTGGDWKKQNDWVVAVDANGNRPGGQMPYWLDGSGGLLPLDQSPITVNLEGYDLGNLFLLGIPADLG
jgi:hypothetical protein